jgi:hypothetical protein
MVINLSQSINNKRFPVFIFLLGKRINFYLGNMVVFQIFQMRLMAEKAFDSKDYVVWKVIDLGHYLSIGVFACMKNISKLKIYLYLWNKKNHDGSFF